MTKSFDPYDANKCDMCGQRQESVSPRKVITVGAWSSTVRWKFCDECVVVMSLQRMPKPPPDADFLVFFNVEDSSQVLINPQSSAARAYLEKTAVEPIERWLGCVLMTKETFVISLARKLLEARFKVVGDRAIVNQMPRLYLHEGEWNIYTGGHEVPSEVVSQIGKGVGEPN